MIDYARHETVFHPVEWGKKRVDVIGVGATGSKVAMSLAKLGVQNLHVWDDDNVEAHNLANQVYGVPDIGIAKTLAISEHISQATGLDVTRHGRWTPAHARSIGQVVFVMVDSMAVRKEIYDAFHMNTQIDLIVDPRLGAKHGHVLTYKPGDRPSTKQYATQLYSDDDAMTEVSACGTAITVGPTADIIGGFCVWAFIRHASGVRPEAEIAVQAEFPSLTEI